MNELIEIEKLCIERLKKIDLSYEANKSGENKELINKLWTLFYNEAIKWEPKSQDLEYDDVFLNMGNFFKVDLVSDSIIQTIEDLLNNKYASSKTIYSKIIFYNYIHFELLQFKGYIDKDKINLYEYLVKMLENGGAFRVHKGYIEFDCGLPDRTILKR